MLPLLALLAACSPTPPDRAADSVLIVYVDTLRADHLGVYGHTAPTSPRVDALGAGGVVFDRAYAASPWTFSSTASLVTGLYPGSHGAGLAGDVRNESTKDKGALHTLSRRHTTLAEVALGQGFHTALFARNGYLGFGNEQGYRTYRNAKASNAKKQVDAALAWLADVPTDERFLLTVHFMDVHTPNVPPKRHRARFPAAADLDADQRERCGRFDKQYSRGYPSKVDGFEDYKACREAMYDASIRFVDEQVGRLVRRVRARDGGDRVLVVFTADHGEEIYDHASIERARYRDPRRIWGVGHGHALFDELVRVPLVLNLPGALPPTREPAAVSLVDVMPTVLGLLDLPYDGPADGVDLAPAWGDGDLPARTLFSDEVAFGTDRQAIIDGTYKLIRGDDDRPLLYDVVVDPDERADLSRSHPTEVARLDALWRDEQARTAAILASITGDEAPEVHTPDSDERAALEALGYLWDDEDAAADEHDDGAVPEDDAPDAPDKVPPAPASGTPRVIP